MGMFNKNSKDSVIERLAETKLFEYVMDELADGNKQRGEWGQAMVECEGNKTKAEAAYIRLRVQSLKDSIALGNIIEDETLKEIQSMLQEEEISPPIEETRAEIRAREKAEMMERVNANLKDVGMLKK